jgi:hypothetical protein
MTPHAVPPRTPRHVRTFRCRVVDDEPSPAAPTPPASGPFHLPRPVGMIRIGLGVQMARFSTERWAALAGFGFVVAYVAAFSMGIEVGPSDREILDYYADSGHRAREMVAFFLIAAAALCLLLFSHGIRVVVDRAGPAVSSAARVAFAGGAGRVGTDPCRQRALARDGFRRDRCGV